MNKQEMIEKLTEKAQEGETTAKIIAKNGNDNYEIEVKSAVVDPEDGHYNAVVTIYANGQFFMTKPFINIVNVFDKLSIESVC